MEMHLRIVALDHVQLAMPDGQEEVARQFYSGLTGIPKVQKPPHVTKRGSCCTQCVVTVLEIQNVLLLIGCRFCCPRLLGINASGQNLLQCWRRLIVSYNRATILKLKLHCDLLRLRPIVYLAKPPFNFNDVAKSGTA